MRTVTTDKLINLQANPDKIRNICILAHVDHGKTTFADSLVASNGVISQKLAGKLRYMDSREDEQQRGITMKSSSIALYHKKDEEEYLINLIDSPGHVDFSAEVSAAVRLCDGALILVDVIEGICPQTKGALRQAWIENLQPVLVLNKVDRLITERKLTPLDAYLHLQQVLEQINAVVGELFTVDVLGKSVKDQDDIKSPIQTTDNLEPVEERVYDWSSGLEETDDSNVYFSPEEGNVIFGSALDGWGFRISDFADLYAAKTGIRADVLKKTLWGDFYLNSKTKRIMKGAQAKTKKPLFVQFILENIWSIYENVLERRDRERTEKIISSLNLKVNARDLKHSDPRVTLQALFTQWLPLSKAALDMVCTKLPSPLQMPENRAEKLMCSLMQRFETLPQETQELKKDFLSCSSSPASPVIVFVSKMFAVESKFLPKNKLRPLTAEEIALRRQQAQQRRAQKMAAANILKKDSEFDDELNIRKEPESKSISESQDNLSSETNEGKNVFIAFARVFSGKLQKGQRLFVLGPKHNPAKALEKKALGNFIDENLTLKDLKKDQHITSCVIGDLFILMGRELETVFEVPAGNLIGIAGLEDHILKTATISDSIACSPFTDLHFQTTPILRVALEPVHPVEMPALINGLKLLNQADPCVQMFIQETGEHVIVTAGEVHLNRCLDDLRERYSKIEISVSQPIVPFRETIILPPKVDMVNEIIEDKNQIIKSLRKEPIEDNAVVINTSNKLCTIKIRAVPLPTKVTQLLEQNSNILKVLTKCSVPSSAEKSSMSDEIIANIENLKKRLSEEFNESGKEWEGCVEQIWSFGPRRCGSNILLCCIPNYKRPSIWELVNCLPDSPHSVYDSSFINGFQMATLAGPLCEEPMMGVCFAVEAWDINSESLKNNDNPSKSSETDSIESHKMDSAPYGPFSGQIMSSVKEGCRRAFQAQPQRLLCAMYSCNIQVTAEALGKMYAVLGKRSGRILSSDLQEGSQMFNVTATLPVIESFDFANEIRRKTSGYAMPQLIFSHWEVVDTDPFWVPTTEEEYALFGEKADSENRARSYMNAVRRRKGLPVQEKIVEHAEKQRTLTRNK